ncbi:MAG: NAD(P)H-dependent oxidoreductase [Propionibacteriaceae bacterium]|nr:NAD(P)H-dependent oxidoreductase [Propionibacteriaceae bacterium]
MRIGIVLGSIREGRKGKSVADWVMSIAEGRDDASYELIDLAQFDLPLVTDPQIPATRQGKYDNQNVQRWGDTLAACDGYVFVTPEYNHSVPGAFKNAIDHLGPELQFKPVAFVSYGAEGGVRAVEHWRVIVANFNMWGLRNQVSLNLFTEFDADGVAPNERRPEELNELLGAVVKAAGQLAS